MNNLKTILCLVLLSILTKGYTQDLTDQQIAHILETKSESDILKLNTNLILNKNYYHASLTADKLLTFDSISPNYNYRKGFTIINSSDEFVKALKFLEIAVTNVDKNFDMMSPKEKVAPIDAYFYMGRAYHLSGKIDKAVEFYEKFIAEFSKNEELVSKASMYLLQCNVAKEMYNTPVDFKITNLGDKINTSNPEYSPVISLDGSALYFTSRRLYSDSINLSIREPGTNLHLEDVYVAYKDENNQWGTPEIMEFCRPEFNEATVAVSSDERNIYVYIDETGDGDIYYSKYKEGKFQNLKILETNGINTESWETHLSTSPDGKRKYFVSDRDGGFGGRDIYYVEQVKNGVWSEPVNLGPTINTPFDEDAPFISVDNKTMYFAHNGPKSMGGFDIFKSEMDSEGNWSEPTNLGYPLNSTSDDIYYTSTVDGKTGYMASFRPEGYGEKDIYEITNSHLEVNNITALLGEIETVDNKPLPEDIAFTVKCMNCDEPTEFTLFPRISDGTFFASLEPCKEYEITFHYQDGEVEVSKETVKTECSDKYEEIYRHLVFDVDKMAFVDPNTLIDSFEPLAMKHFFGYNNNKLNPDKGALKIFLDSLNSQIQNGRTSIEIEINASASTVPTKTFKNNKELANERAIGVKENLEKYFQEKGLGDSIKLKVNKIEISGPKYTGDYKNKEKYGQYQFVELNLSGINSIKNETELIKSADEENTSHVNTPKEAREVKDKQGDIFISGDLKNNEYKYHIVIGVFGRIHYAEGMVKSAVNKGFNAEIIGKRNNMHVVSAGHANTVKEAKEILNRARNEVIQSAWILNLKK
ncbi:MAG TPA: SPOR domain-containing protein [Brumimicrobium sp.]|nr:SPOR domain-containing protein [Brumimicrobium sp.]